MTTSDPHGVLNYFKLKAILSIAVLVIAPWGGGTTVKALEIQPVHPGISIPTFSLIEPLPDISPVAPPKLELAGLHFDSMGSHPNSYAPANCTYGASSMEPAIPQNWGNANTWDDNARAAGITVSDTPIVGAIAQTDRGYYGHVAVVIAIDPSGLAVITEMNYDGMGSVRTRLAAPGEFVYIYI